MTLRRRALVAILVAAAALGAGGAARADLMSGCALEIGRFCAGVTEGRGRVSACLASRMSQLSASCQPEVKAVAQGLLTPGYVRKVLDPAFRSTLPQVCVAPAAEFCPGMAPGEGPIFACLYAFSDRVGEACADAAHTTMRAPG